MEQTDRQTDRETDRQKDRQMKFGNLETGVYLLHVYLLGDAPPIEADERFSETWDCLSQLLTQQAVVYEEEEHALRVLMEEEVMEAMASSKSGVWRGGREGDTTIATVCPHACRISHT